MLCLAQVALTPLACASFSIPMICSSLNLLFISFCSFYLSRTTLFNCPVFGGQATRRLAQNPDVSVLLLEAGGTDDVPGVMEAGEWHTNLGSDRDWAFQAQPNPHLNGRSISMNMGKVLGGGSSINAMGWARGHKNDWDYFASEAGDPAWSYESVLNIYRRIEDWHGAPDPKYRGTGGPVFVQPVPDPSPVALAMLEGTRSVGIPTFENQNGRMT